MTTKLNVTSRNTNGESAQKSYGNINSEYIAQIGVPELTPTGAVKILPYTSDGTTVYSTFWNWSDAVARTLYTLSADTYINSTVSASWDVNEEVEE